jgi:glucose-6-phosphate 1-dehydrogenase
MASMPAALSAVSKAEGEESGAYERLLTDAMHGDAMLFVREDAVEAAWSIVQPVLENATSLHSYEPGTSGTQRS